MDRVKHVAMQRCHIAQWHDGLKRSRKAMAPFRTTSVQNDSTWKTTASLLLDANRRWTARELAAEDGVGLYHKTLLHILGYLKLAACWILHEITDMQQWHRYVIAQALLERLPKGRWQVSWTNRCYGRNLGLLIRTKLETPIKWMCCECDVHCGVWHWWVILHHALLQGRR